MSFNQEELNAIAFEIMRQELQKDMHGPIKDLTAKRLREDYLVSSEIAEVAAKSAMERWTEVYYPD